MAVDYFANPPAGIDLTESRTASNNAIGIVLFVLSFVFVGLRLLTRLRLKREPLGLDDHLMFLGLALNAGNLACCIAGKVLGHVKPAIPADIQVRGFLRSRKAHMVFGTV
jgi:hypothetical protein